MVKMILTAGPSSGHGVGIEEVDGWLNFRVVKSDRD